MSDARKANVIIIFYNIMDTCCICLKNDDRDIVELNCSHIYHRECIEKWILESNTCPLCKSSITSITNINNDFYDFSFWTIVALLFYD